MGYPRVPMASLWPSGGNKANWRNNWTKRIFFFQKNSLSFLPHYCHSFHITVIPSIFLSFLPDLCHSFQISVIPSKVLPFQIFVILNSSNTLPYPKGEKNGHQRWPYMRVNIRLNHSCKKKWGCKCSVVVRDQISLQINMLTIAVECCNLTWLNRTK
jgi:hypothetical protein